MRKTTKMVKNWRPTRNFFTLLGVSTSSHSLYALGYRSLYACMSHFSIDTTP